MHRMKLYGQRFTLSVTPKDWVPNAIRMSDDGTHGDVAAGEKIEYKYTNSGARGEWIPGEEFPARNRSLTVEKKSSNMILTRNIFGK